MRAEVEAAFKTWFHPFFARNGFRARRWDLFERPSNDIMHVVSIGPRRKARGGFGLTGGGFGIRIEAIEELRREHPYAMTAGMPLHMLAPGAQLRHEWLVTNADEVGFAAREIQPAIERYGLPYLEQLGSFADILHRLEADDEWPKWFACSQDGRNSLWVYAIAASEGREAALVLGRRLREGCRDLPYNRSLLLAEAIQRCEEIDASREP